MSASSDALFKAENLSRKKNFQIPAGKVFFSGDILQTLENIIAYLQTFNTQVLSMSKTERQTLVFILENLSDYLKNSRLQAEDREKKNLFGDFEVLDRKPVQTFRPEDQRLAVTASKGISPKNLFGPQDALPDELIYGNATLNFSLFPFVIFQKGQVFFLSRLAETGVTYCELDSSVEITLNSEGIWLKLAEFHLANFCFAELERIQAQLPKDAGGFLNKWREVAASFPATSN